ncbi:MULTISPECIES: hypothetical protein [unclassified Yoonia]|uniref:hypothetical protein n=1 Tax=unclassified Yoonia TaxID=2629118 RepID=UPI002AFFE1B7|nr:MULTISPECIES: hypothetical protein [unclassified Yoonia]
MANLVATFAFILSMIAVVYLLLLPLSLWYDPSALSHPYPVFLIILSLLPIYAFKKAAGLRHSRVDNRWNALKGIAAMLPVVANFGYFTSGFPVYDHIVLLFMVPLVLATAITLGFLGLAGLDWQNRRAGRTGSA